MGLDIICFLLYVLGTYKGLKNGLMAAVLTLIAYVVALLVSIQFGSKIAAMLTASMGETAFWVPTVSFLIVFISVILLFKFLISLVNKAVEFAMLGWINKIGGVLFYLALYTLILTIIFYWLSHIAFLKSGYLGNSYVYTILHDKLPVIIRFWGSIWPSLETSFKDLQHLLH
jgi:membrane protein required for colicin V production